MPKFKTVPSPEKPRKVVKMMKRKPSAEDRIPIWKRPLPDKKPKTKRVKRRKMKSFKRKVDNPGRNKAEMLKCGSDGNIPAVSVNEEDGQVNMFIREEELKLKEDKQNIDLVIGEGRFKKAQETAEFAGGRP